MYYYQTFTVFNLIFPGLSFPTRIAMQGSSAERDQNTMPLSRRENAMAIVITPGNERLSILPRGIWQYRELFFALVRRDLKVRYKQTVVGAAWAVIQPVALMIVFTVFVSYIVRFPSDGAPYPLFAFCGLLPWQIFARALGEGSSSVVTNQALIQKIYFPRVVLPASVVISSLVDFGIAFLILLLLLAYYGVAVTLSVLLVPLLMVLAVAISFGVALFLSAMYVRFRDIRHILPLLTQVWFFASPVFYPSSLVPEAFRPIYGLNPMVGIIEAFRWALLPTARAPDWAMLGVSSFAMILLVAGGLVYFRRCERTFADRL